MNYLFSIFMAIVAYSFLSTGFVLMKKGIGWIGWGGKRNSTFYTNLFWWTAGFIIMNIYGIPSAIALKRLPPHIVAAFAGWGIVVLVFFSHFLLKEKIFKRDFIFSLLIVCGIFILNFFERVDSKNIINIKGMIFLSSIPVVLLFSGFIGRVSPKFKTLVFASVSGISAGMMVVFIRLLVLTYQFKVLLYFNSPYLYLYIGFAFISFIALQMALKNGPMIIIGPVQYSTTIIYPIFGAFFIFNRLISFVQFLSIGLIVYSVTNILRKR